MGKTVVEEFRPPSEAETKAQLAKLAQHLGETASSRARYAAGPANQGLATSLASTASSAGTTLAAAIRKSSRRGDGKIAIEPKAAAKIRTSVVDKVSAAVAKADKDLSATPMDARDFLGEVTCPLCVCLLCLCSCSCTHFYFDIKPPPPCCCCGPQACCLGPGAKVTKAKMAREDKEGKKYKKYLKTIELMEGAHFGGGAAGAARTRVPKPVKMSKEKYAIDEADPEADKDVSMPGAAMTEKMLKKTSPKELVKTSFGHIATFGKVLADGKLETDVPDFEKLKGMTEAPAGVKSFSPDFAQALLPSGAADVQRFGANTLALSSLGNGAESLATADNMEMLRQYARVKDDDVRASIVGAAFNIFRNPVLKKKAGAMVDQARDIIVGIFKDGIKAGMAKCVDAAEKALSEVAPALVRKIHEMTDGATSMYAKIKMAAKLWKWVRAMGGVQGLVAKIQQEGDIRLRANKHKDKPVALRDRKDSAGKVTASFIDHPPKEVTLGDEHKERKIPTGIVFTYLNKTWLYTYPDYRKDETLPVVFYPATFEHDHPDLATECDKLYAD